MSNESHSKGGGSAGDQPRKTPKFAFTVEEVSEADLQRQARRDAGTARSKRAGPIELPRLARHGDDADPGTWEWATVGALVLLLPLVYWLQQWSLELRGETLSSAPAEVVRSEAVKDAGVSELAVWSKFAVKVAFLSEEAGDRSAPKPLAEIEQERKAAARSHAGTAIPDGDAEEDADAREQLDSLASIAWTRIDRVRVAIVAGELIGARAALDRIAVLEKEADAGGELAAELYWLRQIYEKGPETIPPEAADAIVSRHGWFGRLAVSFGKHPSDPARWEAVSGGERVVGAIVGVIIVLALVTVGGFVLCGAAFFRYRSHGYLLRYVPPSPGGSIYLETFVVFLAGLALLLLLQLFLFGLGVEGTTGAAALGEVVLWALVAAAFWPRIRGVSWSEWSQGLGLHRGEGVMREMMCGVLAYLAAQPLIRIGQLIGAIVEDATRGEAPAAKFGYGMFEAPAQGSWALFALGILSAVVWAPLIEETVFRGAFFRYLTTRMGIVWAALLTSAIFGAIHPYTTAGLVSVGVSGLAFAAMRRWRGSLIAPMTAHALHNAIASSMTLGLVTALGS